MNTALFLSAQRSPSWASFRAPVRTVSRADHDFYPTPPEAVRALLSVESFDGPIWEPACGDSGHDFLSPITLTRVMIQQPQLRHIITKPPYGYQRGIGDKFVGQALKVARITGGKVAMLLNLASLASRTRTAKWRNDPPARIHVLDDLICWPNGNPVGAGLFIVKQRYCWIVWSPDRQDGTRLSWLRMAEFGQE